VETLVDVLIDDGFSFLFFVACAERKKKQTEKKKNDKVMMRRKEKNADKDRGQEATSGEKKEMAEHKVLQTFVFARVSSKEERR